MNDSQGEKFRSLPQLPFSMSQAKFGSFPSEMSGMMKSKLSPSRPIRTIFLSTVRASRRPEAVLGPGLGKRARWAATSVIPRAKIVKKAAKGRSLFLYRRET